MPEKLMDFKVIKIKKNAMSFGRKIKNIIMQTFEIKNPLRCHVSLTILRRFR